MAGAVEFRTLGKTRADGRVPAGERSPNGVVRRNGRSASCRAAQVTPGSTVTNRSSPLISSTRFIAVMSTTTVRVSPGCSLRYRKGRRPGSRAKVRAGAQRGPAPSPRPRCGGSQGQRRVLGRVEDVGPQQLEAFGAQRRGLSSSSSIPAVSVIRLASSRLTRQERTETMITRRQALHSVQLSAGLTGVPVRRAPPPRRSPSRCPATSPGLTRARTPRRSASTSASTCSTRSPRCSATARSSPAGDEMDVLAGSHGMDVQPARRRDVPRWQPVHGRRDVVWTVDRILPTPRRRCAPSSRSRKVGRGGRRPYGQVQTGPALRHVRPADELHQHDVEDLFRQSRCREL